MGLLSKATNNVTPQKKATDDALLLHGMMLMASADGTIGNDEMAQVESYFMALPEFKGKNWNQVYNDAVQLVRKYPNLQESVKALGELSSKSLKEKVYLLAADIAMSSGDVDESEDHMLEAIQRVCEVQDNTAQKILDVLTMKYARPS